jgi:uncharacterized protein YjbI with pentapeptide repeats
VIRLLATIAAAVTLVATSASAFDPVHLKRLKDTGICSHCNLSRANLRGADLTGANLTGANLEAANLEAANLSGTLMKGAILCNTTMPDGSVIYSGC